MERGGEGGHHRIERAYGKFMRSFSLPTTVDPDGIEASMKQGVLTVSLAKRTRARGRNVPVQGEASEGEPTVTGSGGENRQVPVS